MRRTPTRTTATVSAALLALAACGPGDEASDGGQEVTVDGPQDAPTEDAPPEDVEEAPSADGDPNWSGPPSDQSGGAPEEPGGPMDAFATEEPPESEENLPDELLRVEVVYPDGTTASNVDHLLAIAGGSDPEEPALNPYTGDRR